MTSLPRLVALLVALWAWLPAERPDASPGGPIWSVAGLIERAPLDDGDPRARRTEHGCEALGATSRSGAERGDGPPPADLATDGAAHGAHGACTTWTVVADGSFVAQAFLRVNGSADGHGKRA